MSTTDKPKSTKRPAKPIPHHRPGRPSNPATGFYQLRMSEDDRSAWQALADAAGMELSQWIRAQCAIGAKGRMVSVSINFKTEY